MCFTLLITAFVDVAIGTDFSDGPVRLPADFVAHPVVEKGLLSPRAILKNLDGLFPLRVTRLDDIHHWVALSVVLHIVPVSLKQLESEWSHA